MEANSDVTFANEMRVVSFARIAAILMRVYQNWSISNPPVARNSNEFSEGVIDWQKLIIRKNRLMGGGGSCFVFFGTFFVRAR